MNTVVDLVLLKRLIKEKYGSQSAFARALQTSRQYVFAIVTGEREPSIERLVEFSDLLDVSTDELLGKEGAPTA